MATYDFPYIHGFSADEQSRTMEGMRSELQAVRNDPNAAFFFAFVQARAAVY